MVVSIEALAAIRDEKRALLDRIRATRTAIEDLASLLSEIEEKFKVPPPVLPLWRAHKSHMWYRSYRARETPQPYAMVSVFVYTRHPDDYPESLFDDALRFIESDPEAFPTFEMARLSASKAAVRKGYSAPGAYYEVEGIEREKVDEDEIGDYEEDEVRYYVALYRIHGNVVRIYREYWGRLEGPPWRIFAQDKSSPKWKKTEELGWPTELEL